MAERRKTPTKSKKPKARDSSRFVENSESTVYEDDVSFEEAKNPQMEYRAFNASTYAKERKAFEDNAPSQRKPKREARYYQELDEAKKIESRSIYKENSKAESIRPPRPSRKEFDKGPARYAKSNQTPDFKRARSPDDRAPRSDFRRPRREDDRAPRSDFRRPRREDDQAPRSDFRRPRREDDRAPRSDFRRPRREDDRAPRSDFRRPRREDDRAPRSDFRRPRSEGDQAPRSDFRRPRREDDRAEKAGEKKPWPKKDFSRTKGAKGPFDRGSKSTRSAYPKSNLKSPRTNANFKKTDRSK